MRHVAEVGLAGVVHQRCEHVLDVAPALLHELAHDHRVLPHRVEDATLGDEPAGLATLLEYHRMPRPDRLHSRWGYVGNMFVREELRNRGIGSALLAAIVAEADTRGYARLVLSPTERAVPLYRRAGL